MKFKDYLLERNVPETKAGITFVDIDETLFKTFAKILIIKDGKTVGELDNQEFNSYELKDGESYDFQQFRDAKLFKKTSVPIPETINRIKKMLGQIKSQNKKSKIIFLTARASFDNKDVFLSTFKEQGINMDKSSVYVERVGDFKGTIPEKKAKVILEYLKTLDYYKVRLIDDHKPNLTVFNDLMENLPKDLIEKAQKKFDLKDKIPFQYFALHIDEKGKLKLIK